MRIAQIAPIAVRVPPVKYGGTERIIHTLTEELVRRGHQVTLFASGDTQTSARLISVVKSYKEVYKTRDPFGLNELTLLNLSVAYEHQDLFDVIHDHLAPMSAPFANFASTPTILTQHGPFTENAKKLYKSLPDINVVTISEKQAKLGAGSSIATIYHGLKMNQYPYSVNPENYLLYVGRISMEKGVHHAIEVAQRLNMKIVLAAKLDAIEMPYFEKYIKPKLTDPRVKWVGEVDENRRNKLMSKALCLLHPVTWPEPFGLSLIEALACACPVVAFRNGSIPEIVKDGEVGYVVKNVREMVTAVKKIKKINRLKCREYSINNFSVEKMADGYEAIYERVIAQKYMPKTNGHAEVKPSLLQFLTKSFEETAQN